MSVSDHIHDYEFESQRCRWCDEPRLNGEWPKKTWFQNRLLKVLLAQLEKEENP